MEEVINHINSLIKKYGSQPQYLEALKKHCLENLETIVIEKVVKCVTRQNTVKLAKSMYQYFVINI